MQTHLPAKSLTLLVVLPAIVSAAAPTIAGQAVLEEVMVTAQKRSQKLQDVPISLVTVSGDTIVKLGITGMADLSTFVPNFDVATGLTVQVRMRGLGSGTNKGFEQSVGMYVDGVYLGRSRQYRSSLLDLERVEVLRGPQGILFGQNTIAGAVNITTAKPTETLEASLLLRAGEYQQREVRATVSGPFTDTLSGRLAIIANHEDGYVENNLGGVDGPENDNQALRGSLQWRPGDNWQIDLKLEKGDYVQRGITMQMTELGAGKNPGVHCRHLLPAQQPGFRHPDTDRPDFAGGLRHSL